MGGVRRDGARAYTISAVILGGVECRLLGAGAVGGRLALGLGVPYSHGGGCPWGGEVPGHIGIRVFVLKPPLFLFISESNLGSDDNHHPGGVCPRQVLGLIDPDDHPETVERPGPGRGIPAVEVELLALAVGGVRVDDEIPGNNRIVYLPGLRQVTSLGVEGAADHEVVVRVPDILSLAQGQETLAEEIRPLLGLLLAGEAEPGVEAPV